MPDTNKFDGSVYIANKAKQLVDSGKYKNYNEAADAFNKALRETNYTPEQHYNDYGKGEGIIPYAVKPDPLPIATPGAVALDWSESWGKPVEGVFPEGSFPLSNPSFTNTGTEFVGGDSLASNRAAGLLKTDHPLFEAASGQATRWGNARGLQNTTITGSMANNAIMGVAADLGKHEAAMFGTAQQAAQQGKVGSALAEQQAKRASDLKSQDYVQTSMLSDQQIKQQGAVNQALSAQQAQQAKDLSAQQYQQTMGIQEMTNQFQQQLAQMGFDHGKSLAIATSVTGLTNTLMSNIGSLLNNTDIEMSDSVVEWLSGQMDTAIAGIGSILSQDIQVV